VLKNSEKEKTLEEIDLYFYKIDMKKCSHLQILTALGCQMVQVARVGPHDLVQLG
jgi:hypothetical protein